MRHDVDLTSLTWCTRNSFSRVGVNRYITSSSLHHIGWHWCCRTQVMYLFLTRVLLLIFKLIDHWHVLSSILDASQLASWQNICICSIISASPLPEKISKRIPAHVIVRIAEPFAIEDLTCRTILLRRLVPLRPHVLYMIGQFSAAFRSTARALFYTCHSVKGTIRTQILQLSPPRELPIDDTSSTIVSSSGSGKRAHCMKLQVSLVRLNYSPPSRMTIWQRNLNVRGERSPKRVKHAFRYLESTAAPEAIERFLQAWLVGSVLACHCGSLLIHYGL